MSSAPAVARRVAAACALLLAMLAPAAATAHALDVGTARVTLRDEHVEVLAEWDLFLLVEATPTVVATQSEADLAETHRKLRRAVERETTLKVDGQPRALELRGFPAPPELRAMAATMSAGGQDHGALVRLRLEAPDTVRDARTLTLTTPKGLGAVAVSFVQPATRYVASGEAATFTVLAPPSAPTAPSVAAQGSSPAPAEREPAWHLGFVAVAALLAVTAALRARRVST